MIFIVLQCIRVVVISILLTILLTNFERMYTWRRCKYHNKLYYTYRIVLYYMYVLHTILLLILCIILYDTICLYNNYNLPFTTISN